MLSHYANTPGGWGGEGVGGGGMVLLLEIGGRGHPVSATSIFIYKPTLIAKKSFECI